MSKGIVSIVVDPEFQALIPPLSADERALLEASIKAEGVRDALRVWNCRDESILLDGHNRHAIATALGIAPAVEAVPGIETRDDAIVWIIRNQLGRRNLDGLTRVELARRMAEAMLRAKAKANQGKGGRPPASEKGSPKCANHSDPVDTREGIAAIAGVSHSSVDRANKILDSGVTELKAAVKSGAVSLNAGACIASLPEDEQRAVVAGGPAVVRTRATEIRNGVPRQEPKPEPEVEFTPPSNRPGRPKSDATLALDAKVQELAAQGFGTGDIAKEVGADPHRVSESKRRLGMTRAGSGNPLAGLTEQAREQAGAWEFALETLNHKMSSATQQQRNALSDELRGLTRAVKRLVSVLAKSEERETESC